MDLKEIVDKSVEKNLDLIIDLSDKVWNFAELSFVEFESVKLYIELLKSKGFKINENVSDIPTAFSATFGEGKPHIGLLAEYDALPNLSQEAGVHNFSPIEDAKSGHGCGHNLLGAASFGAALSVKEYLEENNLPGTVTLFGCPAEENGVGKTFMARDGAFDDLDLALTWHPGDENNVWNFSSLASLSIIFHFKGITSHAAASPHLGRSALDTAEIMNVGANYLREHVIQEARIHYAFLDTGGSSPNVVQDTASVNYYVRAPKVSQALEIMERLKKIAEGSAIMNGTTMEYEIVSGLSDFRPNETLSQVLFDSMNEIGAPEFDEEDFALAKEFYKTFDDNIRETAIKKFGEEALENPLHTEISPLSDPNFVVAGSTDVGDVSYVVPTGQFIMASSAMGTPHHSWQLTAQGNSSISDKTLATASKVLALTAIKAINDEEIVSQARSNWLEDTGGKYIPPIPEGLQPKLDLYKKEDK